jgi:hypothetical protein
MNHVATLALGSRPRQRFVRLQAKREAQESHLMLLGVQKCVRECTFTLPNEFSFWEFESQWAPESSESNSKHQNLLDWKVFYIIGKILKHRCLKWVCMTHFNIWNTSYGQKKGWESNWQFDSRPVATLLCPSVGVKPNTWKKWGFGILRDSRMFRARQQGPKHLVLRCSWCHWKGLEA